MLTLLYRKMINTKWLVLCLLLGFAMAAGMLSTMPYILMPLCKGFDKGYAVVSA